MFSQQLASAVVCTFVRDATVHNALCFASFMLNALVSCRYPTPCPDKTCRETYVQCLQALHKAGINSW
eukprot:m.154141 g.154141  ORF g.154141 m.154141 type:complete len:68 (-) comp16382_c0_seq3:196-399(-)